MKVSTAIHNRRSIKAFDANHQISDAEVTQLFSLAKVPEFQARLRWQDGTLAVWDNRSTQHYAVGDYFPAHRKLHRITITAPQTF